MREKVPSARTNKFSEATYKTNRYSVPTAYAHQNAVVECYANRVRVVVGAEVIAEHARCFGKHQSVLDPLHFLDLLSLNHRAVEHAAVFAHEGFPEELKALLRRYVENDRTAAGENFVRVVSLLKTYPIGQLIDAVELARLRGTTGPEAIALVLDQASQPQRVIERLPIDTAVIGATPPTADLKGYATSLLKECA